MRRVLMSLAALVGLVTVGLAAVPATVAGAASPSPSSIYNSIESPLPGHQPSVGYQATQTSEFGNQISFSSGSGRLVQNVVVTLDSFGCESGTWNGGDCSSTPGDTFSEPVTLNLYDVGGDGTSVGTKFATVTQTFNIPYRPSADANYATDCQADATAAGEPVSDFAGDWYDASTGHCYQGGINDNITFNLANVNVPNTLIYGIAYNTSDYGPHPYGESTACFSTSEGCAYDALNVAVSNDPADVTVGSDPQQGTVYWNTSTAANYCDSGAAGVGTFRIDSPPSGSPSCWSEDGSGNAPYYVPSVQFNAVSASTTATTPTSSTLVFGGSNTDTATVTGNATSGSPTGTVQFYECGPSASAAPCTSTAHAVGSPVALTAGANNTATASSVSFKPTAGGTWCFAGVYSGDSNYVGSSDTTIDECFTVTAATSSTTTVPQSTTMVYGATNYDTATVTGNAGGSPTGTVAFYECGPVPNPTPCTSTANLISEGELTAGPSDTATANSVGFTPTSSGYWCFAGYYLGTASYHASSDASLDECFDVSVAPTKTTTAPIDSTIQLGQKVNDQATVTDTAPGGTPDSSVSFYVCGPSSAAAKCTSTADPVGSPVALTPGSGSSSTATSMAFKPTAVGYWCFAAKYAGDTNYGASSDTATAECVNVEGPVTIVTTSIPSGTKGKSYSTTLVARGGTTPYAWRTLGSVKLPHGLQLNRSTGVISGSPTVSGTFNIEFQVAASTKPIEYATKTLKLVIAS